MQPNSNDLIKISQIEVTELGSDVSIADTNRLEHSANNLNFGVEVSGDKRNAAGAFSAAQSTITGTGVSSIIAFQTYTVVVTAKDSSGINIGTGGEKIWIKLEDECDRTTNFECVATSGSTHALSSMIWTQMTDNSDGTYSYSYSVSHNGVLSITVFYFQGSGLYWEWFDTVNWSGSIIVSNISSTIDYDFGTGQITPTWSDYWSGRFYTLLRAPTTDSYTFYLKHDSYGSLNINFVTYISQGWCSEESQVLSLTGGSYYYIQIGFYENVDNANINFYWSYTGQAKTIVPSTYLYYPQYVANNPIKVTATWPTGYSGSVAGHTSVWYPVCGDGLRVGIEKCDNGSVSGTGGWASDCTSITAGWVCSGGSSTSADTCTQCGAGYYQNDATNPTTWVTHCSDSKRVGSEKWDDGNTTPNDGCSSDCTSIDSGWVCSGGSSSSADTCTKWPAGYHQNDATNPTTCVTVWGDGLKAGTEKWDDGNTSNSDGCKSDWSSIESSWVCSGGSTTSKDTCTFCSSGYYQNNAANPTACVTKCGDGFRVGSETCDDGNTVSGEGCTADWLTIETSYVWSGGSSTSKDICKMCSSINKTNSSKSKCLASSINTNSKVLVSLLFMLIAIGIAFGVMNSIWFGLVPHSFFSAINQLQLFIIVPLLGGITADEILDFDRGISVWLFSFYFIPVKNIFGSIITYDQDIPYLERIYIESNSSPANLASVVAVFCLLIITHLIVWFIKMWARENYKNSKFTKVVEGTLSFFKFGVYVIFLMECFVYFMLLCVSELERHRLTENTEIVSFTFAVLLSIFWLVMVSIACYEWMKSYDPTLYQKQTYFSCLFIGVKDDWKYRWLGFLFLMRRLLLCIVVLSIRFASFTTKVGVFTGIQICYFLFLCITRPYKAIQDNITEIVTEFFNIVFPAFYFYFNSDSTWTSGIAYFYISLLLIDNMIVAGIQFGKSALLKV